MADEPKETETAPPAAGAEDAAAVTPSQKAVAEAMAAAELSEEPLELYPDWESLRKKDSLQPIMMGERDTWTSKLEFLLAAVSTAVGLGNVWRFAFTCLENGGGAFLFPYIIVVTILGTPLYYFELSLGQFASGNVVVIWDSVPLLKGLGYATLLICVFSMLYYVALLSIAFRYLFAGFSSELPWEKCKIDGDYKPETSFIFEPQYGFTCEKDPKEGGYYTFMKMGINETQKVSSAELYYRVKTLKIADNLDNGLGLPDLYLALCLALVWSLVFLNLMFGTKSSGKCAYFTALFPYAVLVTLFATALSQEGASNGVVFLFTAEWSKLITAEVWFKATVQAFFSLGVGYGAVVTYGSFNPFRQPGLFPSIVICAADTLTSIFAAVTVFASLGSLAYKLGYKTPEEVENVVAAGTGLAFQAYPQVITYLPYGAAQFISFCFFLMLISLGLGSGSSYVHAVSSFIFDRFEKINESKKLRLVTTGVVCFLCFLVGLIFTTRGGQYMTDFFDTYSSGYVVFVTVTISVGGIAYVYGFGSFIHDLTFMYNYQPEKDRKIRYFLAFYKYWGYSAPVVLLAIIAYAFATNTKPMISTYHRKIYMDMDMRIPFPMWYYVLGWLLFGIVVGCVPMFGIYIVLTRKTSTFKKKFLAAIKPNRRWGPKDPKERTAWAKFKGPLIGRKPFAATKLWVEDLENTAAVVAAAEAAPDETAKDPAAAAEEQQNPPPETT